MIELRKATMDDAVAIAQVKDAVWPDEATASAYIAEVINQPEHIVHVATINNRIVGFVEGFITLSNEGHYRWEVDLLAVQPEYRGRGIAPQLVKASTKAGRDMGASLARALIRVGNLAAERTFASCGYAVNDEKNALYVAMGEQNSIKIPENVFLIPVSTFGYRGIWLEGELSAQGFSAARAVVARHGWDVAGAVVPQHNKTAIIAAQEAGYEFVADFCWWTSRF